MAAVLAEVVGEEAIANKVRVGAKLQAVGQEAEDPRGAPVAWRDRHARALQRRIWSLEDLHVVEGVVAVELEPVGDLQRERGLDAPVPDAIQVEVVEEDRVEEDFVLHHQQVEGDLGIEAPVVELGADLAAVRRLGLEARQFDEAGEDQRRALVEARDAEAARVGAVDR